MCETHDAMFTSGISQSTFDLYIGLLRQRFESGIAEYLHHRGWLGELKRNCPRRDFADYRIAWQKARYIAVCGIGLICQIGVACTKDYRRHDVLADFFLELAVHVDARENAETLRTQRPGRAFDGLVQSGGDFAFEIDAGHDNFPCVGV